MCLKSVGVNNIMSLFITCDAVGRTNVTLIVSKGPILYFAFAVYKCLGATYDTLTCCSLGFLKINSGFGSFVQPVNASTAQPSRNPWLPNKKFGMPPFRSSIIVKMVIKVGPYLFTFIMQLRLPNILTGWSEKVLTTPISFFFISYSLKGNIFSNKDLCIKFKSLPWSTHTIIRLLSINSGKYIFLSLPHVAIPCS